jgi:hypothetical protein
MNISAAPLLLPLQSNLSLYPGKRPEAAPYLAFFWPDVGDADLDPNSWTNKIRCNHHRRYCPSHHKPLGVPQVALARVPGSKTVGRSPSLIVDGATEFSRRLF